jgi:transcriptional regulator with XRE-family HTH domain
MNTRTTDEWSAELGAQLRQLRLRKQIEQKQLSEMAGVALNAVKNLESGKGATVSSLIKVLRALGRADWFQSLAPSVSISPLQLLKAKQPRQRVGRRSKHV